MTAELTSHFISMSRTLSNSARLAAADAISCSATYLGERERERENRLRENIQGTQCVGYDEPVINDYSNNYRSSEAIVLG